MFSNREMSETSLHNSAFGELVEHDAGDTPVGFHTANVAFTPFSLQSQEYVPDIVPL